MIITCLDSNTIKKLKNLQFILSQKQQYIRGGGILIAVFLVERILKLSQFFIMPFFSLLSSCWKKRHLLSIKSMLLLSLKDTLIFLLYCNLECDNKINDGSL